MSNGVDFRKLALDLRGQLTAAQSELAALREELASAKADKEAYAQNAIDLRKRMTAAPVVERQAEPVGVLMLGEVFYGTKGPELDDWDVDWYRKPIDELNAANPGAQLKLYVEPPAPVAVVLPERRAVSEQSREQAMCANSWNACLDKVKELNQ